MPPSTSRRLIPRCRASPRTVRTSGRLTSVHDETVQDSTCSDLLRYSTMKNCVVLTSFLAALVAAVSARPEPPVNQYLPPNQQFTPPQRAADFPGSNGPAAGAQYLPPDSNSYPGNQGYGDGSSDEPARYEFEYTVNDIESGNDFGHKESREGSVARGVYYVLLPDGRRQTVEYEADENGFRPKVTYTDEGNSRGGNGGYGGY